ncbi:ammonium transporter [Caulobacter hibisci]|uniref:Ammonium transporter n=1 Tax=Caulobacter hibisci TaxID=2035993 RepID=A0ABS0STL8_9CAUL|nr:ammonium transporter [Caulobacter hibisci]MBI1682561.1 ammonium transporter [Caulobacter hibisci]
MKKDIIADFAWGLGIVVLALAATLARKLGYIDTDMVNRLVMGAIGLMVAWSGNRIPKRFVPNAQAQRASRVAGWSLALSGLVYAGLWAFAPQGVAVVGGSGAILLGLAVTIGYCLSLRDKAKTA